MVEVLPQRVPLVVRDAARLVVGVGHPCPVRQVAHAILLVKNKMVFGSPFAVAARSFLHTAVPEVHVNQK